MSAVRETRLIGDRELSLETGYLAKQSHGAVIVRCGETVVLACVVATPEAKEDRGFFPMTVDYRERTYAAGKIPGGYFKREGRPSEKEILTSRLIDRPIRSLFHEDYRNEVQIMITVLSADGENTTDIPAMVGASAALIISDVPFDTALGTVRVGSVEGKLVVNPTLEEMGRSDLDLIIAGTESKVVMIEGGANEFTEEQMMEAIRFGHDHIKEVVALQKALRDKAGKEKRSITKVEIAPEVREKISQAVSGEFEKVFDLPTKEEREEKTKALYEKALGLFDTEQPDFKEVHVKRTFNEIEKDIVRNLILDQQKRPDGRGFKDIREIACDLGLLPRAHGSAVFTRGQTQSLCAITLGTGEDEQRIDALEGEVMKSFMLHYNFPSFSVGEVRPNRGPGRREIGHGALAERAIKVVMPGPDAFPYTVRIVSDILESNGSSSMATVCAGTLALMDAGVPLSAPVAGIAMGLVTKGDKWKVLTDIAGIEDHLGDMDFKAAGTRKGITALQMDLKIEGVTEDMLREAFSNAKEARLFILDKMAAAIETPRKELSMHAPRITMVKIPPAKIGELIGPGGKNIRKLCEETGAKIDIEDDGTVLVASSDAKASAEAVGRIQAMTEEAEIGKIYQAKVRKLMNFGAFCEIIPGTDGLCHVSEVSDGYVKEVNEYLRIGDIVPAKVIGIDERGKINLSIKQAQEGGVPQLPPDVERCPISESGGGRGGRSGGGGRDRDRSRPRR